MEKKPPLVRRSEYEGWKYDEQVMAHEEEANVDAQDIFTALYRPKWGFNKAYENEKPPLKDFLKKLRGTDEYKALKHTTVGKSVESYVAAEKLRESFVEQYPKAKTKSEKNLVCSEGAKKADEEAKDFMKAYGICGMDDRQSDDKFGGKDIDKIKQLSKMLKQEVYKRALARAGREKVTAAHIINTRADKGDESPVGIEHGDELSKALSSELVLMKDNMLLFMLKLANKEIMQYIYEGPKPQEAGPAILGLDMSGSMQTGAKFIVATGFCFGMYLVMRAQKRDLWIIGFGTRVNWSKQIKGMADILWVMDQYCSGGTDFNDVLTTAASIIEDAKGANPSFKKADLFMITDGFGEVSKKTLEALKKAKEALSFKIISAFIMDSSEHEYKHDGIASLNNFSDEVFPIADAAQMDEFAERGYRS